MVYPALDAKILVAVSGGVDSVYMLQYLVMHGYTNLGIAHFNHMIRSESSGDAKLVSQLATEHKLPFYYRATDIPATAKHRKQSIELVAREERRQMFELIMNLGGYEWVALGHHADDQAETVLFNFMRGTGVHGLAGMKRIDEKQKIFRPILERRKEDIYQSARNFRLEWKEDNTNHGVENDRAWLRNEIIPAFEERRKGTKSVLYDTAERFQELSDFLKDSAELWLETHYVYDQLSCSDFVDLPKTLKAEILGVLWEKHNGSRKDFNHKVVFEVNKWLDSKPDGGTKVYFGTGHLKIKKGNIFFVEGK